MSLEGFFKNRVSRKARSDSLEPMNGYKYEPKRDSAVVSQWVSREVKRLQDEAEHLNSAGLILEIVRATEAIKAEILALNNIEKSKSDSCIARSDNSKEAISQLNERQSDHGYSAFKNSFLFVLTLGAAGVTLGLGIKGQESICEPFLQDPEWFAVAIVLSLLVNMLSGYWAYQAVKSSYKFENEAEAVKNLDDQINDFVNSYNQIPSN